MQFDALNIILAVLFVTVLVGVEVKIIKSWKTVNVRYRYFENQLIASILVVMIFGVLGLCSFMLLSVVLVLCNAAMIWNDSMHKKIMQITYGVDKVQYVSKYRPVYNTDEDSEWLTTGFTLCCSKEGCIDRCRGRWVINCYAGLVTGKITNPTYYPII